MPHDNNAVIDKAVDMFVKETIIPQAIEGFTQTANDIVAWIESNTGSVFTDGGIPVEYGNLRDSTGLAIYAQGKFIDFKPNPIATMPSDYNDRDIWGRDWLAYAISQASSNYSDGNVYLVAFSAVPYAKDVEERTNFFENEIVHTIIQQAFPNLKSTFD